MEQAKGEHKKLFQEFCEKAFLDNDGSKKCTSKTISEEKAVRIKEVLKGKKLEVYMLGAFYKSDQFINCAAQIINS